jgi:imidazole glycerol phosphate synthase subunit HisF
METLAGDELRRAGSLRLAADGEEREAIRAEYEALREDGFDAEWRDELPPRLAASFDGAIFHPGDGALQPAIFVRRLAAAALEAGASRVVLSSSVLSGPELSRDLVDRLGIRAVLGVEADGDRIRPRGVPSRSRDLPLAETLAWVAELGPARYLYTAVARVATMTGPDLDGVRAASALLGRPVLVAGGVRRIEDVRAVQALGPDVAEGCVVGRALYRGLDLVALLSGTASPAAAPDGDP